MAYDAFISYSHSADGRLAPAVQLGLQRLARPWYRTRALRVFRDETGLSVNPHLWGSIEDALDESRYFVLLASPAAAASPWVNREIEHWVAHHPSETILPVVTEGTWAWDEAGGDFVEGADAVPAALRGQFPGEPRHLDLRWARDEDQLDLRHGRFRGAIADLAAPIHGMAKDELESEDVRRHRRGMRLARAAVIALLAFAVTAAVATTFAVSNAAQANEQADNARQSAARARTAEESARRRAREAEQARSAEAAAARQARASEDEAQQAALTAQTAEEAAADERDRAQAAEASAEDEATKARQAETARAQEATRAQRAARAAADSARRANAFASEAEVAARKAEDSARSARTARDLARFEAHLKELALDDARNQTAGARSRALSSSGLVAFDEDRPDLGMLLAVESRNEFLASQGVASDAPARDALLTGLVNEPRLRTVLHGDPGLEPVAIAFDARGQKVASLAEGGALQVWDVGSGRLLGSRPGSGFGASPDLALNDDGLVAFTDPGGAIHLWNLRSGVTSDLPLEPDAIGRAVAFDPEGSTLAAEVWTPATGTAVRLWDVVRQVWFGAPLPVPHDPMPGVTLAFDEGGDRVALGARDVTDGPPGMLTLTAKIFVWDVADAAAGDPTPAFILDGSHHDVPEDGPFDDDIESAGLLFRGTELWSLVSGSSDGALVGWDLSTGQRLFGPGGPTGRLTGISPDLGVIAQRGDETSTGGTLVLRSVLTGAPLGPPLRGLPDGTIGMDRLALFSPDGRTLTGIGDRGMLLVWDWNGGTEPDTRLRTSTALPVDPEVSDGVIVSPDGGLVAVTHAESVQVLDAAGVPLPHQPGADLDIFAVQPAAFSPDGHMIATIEQSGEVRVWDARSGDLRWDLQFPGECDSGMVLFGPPGPDGGAGTVALTCGGFESSGLVTWRLTSPDPDPQLLSDEFHEPLAFSPGGDALAIGNSIGPPSIVDPDTGQPVGPQPPPNGSDWPLDAAFDADGQTLAIAYASGMLQIFDLRSGDTRTVFHAHESAFTTEVAFSPSGSTLYSVSNDRTVQTWDVATLERVGPALTAPQPASGPGLDIAVTPDGRTLVAAGVELVRWDVDVESWVTRACTIANRNLTRSEWTQYFGAAAYRKTCPGLP